MANAGDPKAVQSVCGLCLPSVYRRMGRNGGERKRGTVEGPGSEDLNSPRKWSCPPKGGCWGTVNASNNHISAMFKPLRLNHIYFAYNLWTSSLHTFKIIVRWLIICNTMWTHVDLHMISTDAGVFFPSEYFLSAMVLCGGSETSLVFIISFHFYFFNVGLEDQIQVLRLAWCLNLHLWCCAKTRMRQ